MSNNKIQGNNNFIPPDNRKFSSSETFFWAIKRLYPKNLRSKWRFILDYTKYFIFSSKMYPTFSLFRLINTRDSVNKFCPMIGFEPRIKVFGRDQLSHNHRPKTLIFFDISYTIKLYFNNKNICRIKIISFVRTFGVFYHNFSYIF